VLPEVPPEVLAEAELNADPRLVVAESSVLWLVVAEPAVSINNLLGKA
jgi:hypothetical protein